MRLIKKQDREKVRQYEFDNLTNKGFEKIEGVNVVIFVNYKELVLKSFFGTAANHTHYYKYRDLESLNISLNRILENSKSRQEYKQEQKIKNKGKLSSHAAAAAAIKEELKKAFPNTKFSVTSESYSGGDSIRVNWTNGATKEQVCKITNKYQQGGFNGMIDMYEETNRRNDIPQVKYVFENREITQELKNAFVEKIKKVHQFNEEEEAIFNSRYNSSNLTNTILNKTEIPHNYIDFTISNKKDFSGFFEDSFLITWETTDPAKEIIKEALNNIQPLPIPTLEELERTEQAKDDSINNVELSNLTIGELLGEKTEVKKIQVVDYSDKAFAVIGDFSEHYNKLIQMGGEYNKFLKCGRGIIFSKKNLEEVKNYLSKQNLKR